MRSAMIWALALTVVSGMAQAQDNVFKHGQFEMTMQADNVWLPDTIRWADKDTQLIKPKVGLSLAFTSFEFRNKIYHDENSAVWAGKIDPRFMTDAKLAERKNVEREGFAGIQVEFDSSYSKTRRTVLLHDTDPRIVIEYALEMTRDVVVHESADLAAGIRFGDAFDRMSVCDIRGAQPEVITGTGAKGLSRSASPLVPGPVVVANAQDVGILVQSSCSGDVPNPIPARMLTFKKGQKLVLQLDLTLGAAQALAEKMMAIQKDMPEFRKPFHLMTVATVLQQRKNLKDAEEALLLAARLNQDYAQPYGVLAGLRRDANLPGQTDAWVEGAYRAPYNYGYILSGGGFFKEKDLTEAQRRLFAMDILIAMENTVFYPNYYVWGARPFEDMKMWAQACAMYRQGLWAVDHMSWSEATKEKTRTDFKKKIAELETKMLGQTMTDMPPMIPIRVGEPVK
jgi:hypothetical protein